MKKIAIFIKTTPKRKSILWVLNSIFLKLDNYRLYIADEEPVDDWKIDQYDRLRSEGHYIKVWENPVAVTVARNHLLSKLEDEKYILRLDDDFELGGEFNIDNLLTVLENNQDIHFCSNAQRQIDNGQSAGSGRKRFMSGHIIFREDRAPLIKLVKDTSWKFQTVNNVQFAKADYMRNLILIKREVFDKVTWNENLTFTGEHADFYLSLKKAGYQGAFTPDSVHLHRDDLKSKCVDMKDERKWRNNDRENVKIKEYARKWGGVPEMTYGIRTTLNRIKKSLLRK